VVVKDQGNVPHPGAGNAPAAGGPSVTAPAGQNSGQGADNVVAVGAHRRDAELEESDALEEEVRHQRDCIHTLSTCSLPAIQFLTRATVSGM
jgi:hypothetical protein